MFLELIATFFFGFAAAGVVMILNKALGGRLPRPLIPIAAGAAMIGFTIWNEYNWYPQTLAKLWDGVEVVQETEKSTFYQPWSYLKPYVIRFSAVDLANAKRNEKFPDQAIVDLLLLERWAPTQRVPIAVDCAASMSANLADGMEFDDSGALVGVDWVSLEADDPLLARVCS
jgi:hypothetical protein